MAGNCPHCTAVEAAVGMVQVQFLGPVTNTTTALTRREAQAVALAMIAASKIEEEED